MSDSLGKVALFGATGAVGRSLATALRQRGLPYRVVGRSAASLESVFGADPLAEKTSWNPEDATSVRAAARGVDTLIYLVGVPYTEFRRHPVMMRQTLEGAIAEGVKRILLIGTVYPYGRAQANPVREDHPRQPHTYKGRMRKEQEELLLQAHRDGRIQGAVLRLPDFYGPGVGLSFLDSLFKAAASGGRALMMGPIDRPHQFVFVPDVGPVALQLAQQAQAYGRVWHFAGSGTATPRELSERTFAVAGTRPRRRVITAGMLRLFGLFSPMMRELAEMHYLWSKPVVMDDSALQQLLGALQRTSYEEGIRQCLQAAAAAGRAAAAGESRAAAI
jgi:nucleoside-diphosphate-sugar epimerase